MSQNLGHIVETQRALESSLTQRMKEFEANLKAAKAASPAQAESLTSLSREFYAFRDYTVGIVDLLRRQIQEVSRAVDAIETRQRRKFLLVAGVPEVDNEDPSASVLSILRDNLGLQDISKSSIVVCHRLGGAKEGRCRPLIVKFSDHDTRSQVWQKKTMLKGTPFIITEFLTKFRQALFLDARRHFGMRRVWTLDGNVYIKLPSGSRERVTSGDQLDKLMKAHGGADEAPRHAGPKTASDASKSCPKPGPSNTKALRSCRIK
ncbi:hypothetical protein ABMA27_016867 [Loxostege sticticalis]|uniref:Uncharacterized protein n=1 Tax=Loxostege sticticalis TaxID=481309 RepID=A0ABR3I3Z4_LOXSC